MTQPIPEQARILLDQQRLGFVASINEDGTPNLSPRGTLSVWDEHHLIFADICSPATTANLRTRPHVAISVVDPICRKGYSFHGTARVFSEGSAFEAALEFYRKRGIRLPIQAAVFIDVASAQPVVSPVYSTGATEEEVTAMWLRRVNATYSSPSE